VLTLPTFAAFAALTLATAQAQDTQDADADEGTSGGWVTVGAPPTTVETELSDEVWDNLALLPPTKSWEMAIGPTFSDMSYWRGLHGYTGAFPGLGLGLGYGWHKRDHRFGAQITAAMEGPVPLYETFAFEVLPSWDYVSRGVLIGASLGGAVLAHQAMDEDSAVTLAPVVALRLGPSQPWSRLGRRMFVMAEPKLRLVQGYPNATFSVLIGQGRGM